MSMDLIRILTISDVTKFMCQLPKLECALVGLECCDCEVWRIPE